MLLTTVVQMHPPSPWHLKGYPEMYHCRLALFFALFHIRDNAELNQTFFCSTVVVLHSYKCCVRFLPEWFLSAVFYLSSLISKLLCLNNKQTDPSGGFPTVVTVTENLFLFDPNDMEVLVKKWFFDHLVIEQTGSLIWREEAGLQVF